ncbi:MAG: hypothetical protein P8J94_03100 [Gammaproteobacteria bacterium]|nr:hypothetical protein [Gammaproteobacteria bacterium]|tara:strand:- start:10388 stop:10726 length:339 start_codon:yes stop_codon:yes gene_type:complete
MNDKIKLFKKNIMNRFLVFLVLMIFINPIIASDATKQSSEKYISEAKKTYKKALKLNNAWRDTGKIIKKASKEHSKENYEKSVKLAKEALNQAKMAIEQHNKQRDSYRFLDN